MRLNVPITNLASRNEQMCKRISEGNCSMVINSPSFEDKGDDCVSEFVIGEMDDDVAALGFSSCFISVVRDSPMAAGVMFLEELTLTSDELGSSSFCFSVSWECGESM